MGDYKGKLHVYAQYSPHDDAVIAGDKEALTALRDAITQAIEGKEASFNSFTQDGEGFRVLVKCRHTDSTFFNNVGLPYTADYYGEGGPLDPRDPEADYDVQD